MAVVGALMEELLKIRNRIKLRTPIPPEVAQEKTLRRLIHTSSHTSLGKALAARCGANGVCGLLHQQRFIAVQGVQAAQTFLQMRLDLRQGQLHGKKL